MEPLPRKRPVRKSVKKSPVIVSEKKPVKIKLPAKKTPPTKAKSAAQSKRALTKKTPEEVSFVPGALSLRLTEKRLLYEEWYLNHSPQLMQPLAKVAGYAFIVVGLLTAFASWSPVTNHQANLMALISCTTNDCETSTATSTNPVNPPATLALLPVVRFISSPTVKLSEDTEVEISIANTAEHSVLLISRSSGQTIRGAKKLQKDGDIYRYLLPTKDLDGGEYVLQVATIAINTKTKANFTGPILVVPAKPIEENLTADADEEEDSHSGEDNDAPASTVSTNAATTSVSGVVTQNGSSNTPVTTLADTAEEELMEENDEEEEIPKKPEIPVLKRVNLPLELKIESSRQANLYKVVIKPTYEYERVELYAKPVQSTQALFLGAASRFDGGWQYWLDGTSLPNGAFRIIAQGLNDRLVRDTAEIEFVNNVLKATPKELGPQTEAKQIEIKEKTEAMNQQEEVKNITTARQIPLAVAADDSETEGEEENEDDEEEVEKVAPERVRAKEILAQHSDNFNNLLTRYASAVQTNDETLIRLAESALAGEVEAVLTKETEQNSNGHSISRLDEDIQAELGMVKEKVVRLETLLKERTNADSTKDSDADGISDFDEMMLYKTDPLNPDSDSDGIIDGVEIMLGYDPLSAKPEAIVRFDSPKEVSYVNDAVVSIHSVTPVLEYETPEMAPIVQSEIRGFGLPNSFVTLYIFSTPTVVTIRTNDDGGFSYIFSKELEDGEHEVYVALTDNAGEIVVRSSPLKFVKTAQAFTYVNEASSNSLPPTENAETELFKTYNLVGAMGIVSFGLILLILGQTLRARKTELEDAAAV